MVIDQLPVVNGTTLHPPGLDYEPAS